MKKAWIWFWYNQWTRIFVVLIPTYFVILIPLLKLLGVPEETFNKYLGLIYMGIFWWAVFDNDFSKLRHIGLDEHRRPLDKGVKDD